MIHAYDEVYLERAQRILGVAFDFAVNGLKIELKDFYWMFLASGYAKRMEYGDYRVIAGSSGAELVYNVTEASGIDIPIGRYSGTIDRSPEYWAGWALAYFQWYSTIKYAEIIGAMTIEEIVSLYNPYHEMDIKQFCDKMMEKLSPSNEAKLKKYRTQAGLSQSELARASEVPLRTLQQYEQQQKDINKARGEYLIKLARVLNCEPGDLIRK